MHLSERKHNLPGVPFFNQYSEIFLLWDRATALTGVVHVLVAMFIEYGLHGMTDLLQRMFYQSLIGLAFLTVSENIDYGLNFFTITHCIWHFIAFDILSKAIGIIFSKN